ncbi:MAG: NAD-dependent epimerase/dehydratase family protein [Candidatus Zixiibacteriota bacterium]|nr:MAG: NAD-dependent epimerase/dehydratase family protein [candidate division Zixibacteria bacterium]
MSELSGLQNSKVLVTGASGSLGKQLLYQLCKAGTKPMAHMRGSSDSSLADSLGLEKRIADICSREQLHGLVEGIDAIIHTAAWVNFRKDRLTQFTALNTVAAVELFRAAAEAGVRRFVHVSTVAALGALPRGARMEETRTGDLITEQDKFNLGHLSIPYIMTKHAAEAELRKAAEEAGTELVIVSPSVIVAPSRTGDDRGKASKMFDRLFFPVVPVRVNLVDIRDVATGIVAALQKGKPGERYLLTGDNISVGDLVLAVSAVLGKSPHLVRPPRALLSGAARLSVLFSRLTGRSKLSFYPDIVRLLDFDWVYSSAKAREQLGFQSRSIHSTLNDLLNNNFTGSYMKP